MKDMLLKVGIFGALSGIGSFIATALGGWDSSIQTLLIFIVIDYTLGIICAAVFKKSKKSKNGTLSSAAGFKGICKKAAELIVVIIAVRIDIIIGSFMVEYSGSFVRDGAVIALVLNELLSIIENLGTMGVKIPEVIQKSIDILKVKSQEDIPTGKEE